MTAAHLAVIGEIPDDLHGRYLRNGPNPRFDPIGSYVYPLDGDAMIHMVTLENGTARYANTFVRTPMVVAEERAGRALWSGITDGYTPDADDVGPELAGTTRELPDINIIRHGDHLLAMAESDEPYRLDPIDLSTLGRDDYAGAMAGGSTAHPKIDPATGEMVIFNYVFGEPYLTWSVVGADGTMLRPPTGVDGVDATLMIHDMALTPRFIVLFLCPLIFDLDAAMSGGSLLDWRPDDGTRIALIPRDGGEVRWVRTDAFWVWHFANAFDNADGSVTVDYIEWTHPGGFTAITKPSTSSLVRAVLQPDSGRLSKTVVSARNMEFPRIDDRLQGRDHGTVAAVGQVNGASDAPDGLLFYDMTRGTEESWDPGVAVGEPIFMPGDTRDYWGAFGTDPATLTSSFYIVPADDPAHGPVAEIEMPIRVPAGLHGTWLPQ